jgi:hypothetical protein
VNGLSIQLPDLAAKKLGLLSEVVPLSFRFSALEKKSAQACSLRAMN